MALDPRLPKSKGELDHEELGQGCSWSPERASHGSALELVRLDFFMRRLFLAQAATGLQVSPVRRALLATRRSAAIRLEKKLSWPVGSGTLPVEPLEETHHPWLHKPQNDPLF